MPDDLIIAITAKWIQYPERMSWILEHGLALEYTPNPEALDAMAGHISGFVTESKPVRFHGQFPGYEFGHADARAADGGLQLHMKALEAISKYDKAVITIHIGLNPKDPIDPERAVDNLAALVRRGRELGITVCLENLRRGITSDPKLLAKWARDAGAMITFDAGHASGCRDVLDGELGVTDYMAPLLPLVHEAHVYEIETDRHYPPRDMNRLGPVLDRLLATECRWWTIELESRDEALATHQLLRDYLRARQPNPVEL